MSRAAAAALLAAAAPSPGAAAAPAGIGLSATPARMTLVGAAHATITVRNPGSRALLVAAAPAGLTLSTHGKPRVAAGRAARGVASWLRVRPRRLLVGPGRASTLRVVSTPPRSARPGDHPTLIVLTTRPLGATRVRVRLRVGVVLDLRVPGRIVRRLRPLGLGMRRHGGSRLFELRLANRGNVTERLDGGRLRLVLVHRRRPVAAVSPLPRELLPGGTGVVDFVYRGHLHGPIRIRLEIRLRAGGRVLGRRTYRLRL